MASDCYERTDAKEGRLEQLHNVEGELSVSPFQTNMEAAHDGRNKRGTKEPETKGKTEGCHLRRRCFAKGWKTMDTTSSYTEIGY